MQLWELISVLSNYQFPKWARSLEYQTWGFWIDHFYMGFMIRVQFPSQTLPSQTGLNLWPHQHCYHIRHLVSGVMCTLLLLIFLPHPHRFNKMRRSSCFPTEMPPVSIFWVELPQSPPAAKRKKESARVQQLNRGGTKSITKIQSTIFGKAFLYDIPTGGWR